MTLLPESVRRFFSKAFSLLGKEKAALEELHEESKATVRRMTDDDPGLRGLLENAHAYAVFPSVGKATVVIGGAYGKGEVFQGNQLVGYAGLAQLTLGVQVGGQTFSEIVLFQDKAAFERFKAGRTAFAANASAVLVKAGAAKSARFEAGAAVFISTEGGMMLEAAIGMQKFIFKPAALGRTKSAPETEQDSGSKSQDGGAKSSEADGKKRPDRPRERKPGKRTASKSPKVSGGRSGQPSTSSRPKRGRTQPARRAAR